MPSCDACTLRSPHPSKLHSRLSVPDTRTTPLYMMPSTASHTAPHTLFTTKQHADGPVTRSDLRGTDGCLFQFQYVICSSVLTTAEQMARVIGFASACALLVLLVACTALAARDETRASGEGRGRKVGARTEVRDVEGNREVQELGRYSVEEHNRRQREEGETGGRLEFGRVESAQRQVVSGIKYYLRVAAADDRVFDAVVVVKPWLQSRALLRFAPADAE